MRRWLCMAAAGVLIGLLLTGCSSNQKANTVHNDSSHSEHSHSYKDGTYTAKSSPDERGAVGEITLTIQQGKIAKADYRGIQKDGKVKDIDYGKTRSCKISIRSGKMITFLFKKNKRRKS